MERRWILYGRIYDEGDPSLQDVGNGFVLVKTKEKIDINASWNIDGTKTVHCLSVKVTNKCIKKRTIWR